MLLLILLYVAFTFTLAVAADVACRNRWREAASVGPWYKGVSGTLVDAVLSFPIAFVLLFFLIRIRVFGDGLLASAYGAFFTPPVAFVFLTLSTVSIAILFAWLQVHWTSLAPNNKRTAFALLAAAAILLLVFVKIGSGAYPLSQPPQRAWFAWLGEIPGEDRAVLMLWFAPRFGTEGYGPAISFTLGIVAPLVAAAGALLSLLKGRGNREKSGHPPISPEPSQSR